MGVFKVCGVFNVVERFIESMGKVIFRERGVVIVFFGNYV